MKYEKITPENGITLLKLAAKAGVSYNRLWRAVQRGSFARPTIMHGNRVYYHTADTDKLIAAAKAV